MRYVWLIFLFMSAGSLRSRKNVYSIVNCSVCQVRYGYVLLLHLLQCTKSVIMVLLGGTDAHVLYVTTDRGATDLSPGDKCWTGAPSLLCRTLPYIRTTSTHYRRSTLVFITPSSRDCTRPTCVPGTSLLSAYYENHAYFNKARYISSDSTVTNQCDVPLSWNWRFRSGDLPIPDTRKRRENLPGIRSLNDTNYVARRCFVEKLNHGVARGLCPCFFSVTASRIQGKRSSGITGAEQNLPCERRNNL